ncbi:MAG: hypothetical protein WAM81_11695 [Acidimicrobiia bacterium]
MTSVKRPRSAARPELLEEGPWNRAHRLASVTGLNPIDIGEWGVVERVSTALSCTQIELQPSSKTTAVLIETPDMETLQSALATEEAAQAEKYDGVNAETIRIFVAG